MQTLKYLLLTLSILFFQLGFAQNPIIGNIGISDPHVRVFNDTIYLFSGHDADPDDKTWVMKDWRIFSTIDLVNWSLRRTISPKDNYMSNNSADCWASDAAKRNGKYYFYFSDRKRGIGVMVSNSPTGPYQDPLGKALISPMHDPTILIDDDKQQTPYIIYGDKEGGAYRIAKLNNDMISLAEEPKPIVINGEAWDEAPLWMDKNYLFKYKNTYYLSWGQNYAISDDVYGPYTCVGALGKGYNLNEFAHGSFFWWKGQFYHIWCYYQRMGYKYRESIITYCHIDDEGKVTTDTEFLDQHFANGVGHYRASWPRIEAEWYYEISGDIRKLRNNNTGFKLSNIRSGDWLRFAQLNSEQAYTSFVAKARVLGGNGMLEIRSDNPSGALLGTLKLNTFNHQDLQEARCDITAFVGTKDLYLIFKGSEDSQLQLDWFKFEKR